MPCHDSDIFVTSLRPDVITAISSAAPLTLGGISNCTFETIFAKIAPRRCAHLRTIYNSRRGSIYEDNASRLAFVGAFVPAGRAIAPRVCVCIDKLIKIGSDKNYEKEREVATS